MPRPVHTILVPQGAEYQAVCRGAESLAEPLPQILAIPVGPEPLQRFLEQQLAAGDLAGSGILLLGLCGSLTPRQAIGHVVIYQGCIGFQTQGGDQLLHLCDPSLSKWVGQRLRCPDRVVTLTCDRMIHRAAEKRQLAEDYPAEVVDMEGLAALKVLTRAKIPVAMVRVVSDDCDHNLPNLNSAFNPEGQLQPLPLIGQFLRHPIAAGRLIQGSLTALRVLEQVSAQVLS